MEVGSAAHEQDPGHDTVRVRVFPDNSRVLRMLSGEGSEPKAMSSEQRLGYIDYALMRLSTLIPLRVRKYPAAFVERWGDVDEGALLRALQEGTEDDRLFALFAVGYMGSEETLAHLVPLLEGDNALERWAAATCLAQHGEKRAIPVLCTMLTEFLPETLSDYLAADSPFEDQRSYASTLLGGCEDVSVVPALCHALQRVARLLAQSGSSASESAWEDRAASGGAPDDEVRLGAEAVHSYAAMLDNLIEYRDDIIFALGRLGAVGALTGLIMPVEQMQIAMVHLLLGHLRERYTLAKVAQLQTEMSRLDTRPRSTLGTELCARLQQMFRLDEIEQEQALFAYIQGASAKLEVQLAYDEVIRAQGGML